MGGKKPNLSTSAVDDFIPAVWSSEIIYQTLNASILWNLVRRDYEGDIENQGDIVKIPMLSGVSVGDVPIEDPINIKSTKEVTINKHKYFAFRVENISKAQSEPDSIASYAAQGGRGLANVIDADILSLASNDKVSHAGRDLSHSYQEFYPNFIREANQKLDEAGAPDTDRFLIVSPYVKKRILDLDGFTPADKCDDVFAGLNRTGLVGKLEGVLVYMSRGLKDVRKTDDAPAYKACVMFQREAFALCTQKKPRVQAAYDLDYLATSVVGDVLYGVDLLVPEYAIEVRTKSEL